MGDDLIKPPCGKLPTFVVAWSGDRKPDPTTGRVPAVGSTVDIQNATRTNTIGTPMLTGFWKDPEFDPNQLAFYYVRVLEIPTPRWTAYDVKHFGVKMDAQVPMVVPRIGEAVNRRPWPRVPRESDRSDRESADISYRRRSRS
jgi:hypothetical protein